MKTIRFFEPNNTMIQWLKDYIGNRIPVDVGCGNGDLLIELKKKGIGIDPFTVLDTSETMNLLLDEGIHIMPMAIQRCKSLINGLGTKAMMIFARPCHSSFVEDGIALAPEGMEILYITKPSNITNYIDLGKYDQTKKLVKHKGKAKENEVVYSIIKK